MTLSALQSERDWAIHGRVMSAEEHWSGLASTAALIPRLFALRPKNVGFAPAVCADLISRGRKESFRLGATGWFHIGSADREQSSADWPVAKNSGRARESELEV